MRRRGGGRGAGGVLRAAQGGRGRPRTSEGARARAQENLRARSIAKVPGQEGGVVEGRRPEPGARTSGGCGDWSRKGKDGRWRRPNCPRGFVGFLRASCREISVFQPSLRDKRAEREHSFLYLFFNEFDLNMALRLCVFSRTRANISTRQIRIICLLV